MTRAAQCLSDGRLSEWELFRVWLFEYMKLNLYNCTHDAEVILSARQGFKKSKKKKTEFHQEGHDNIVNLF